MPPTERMRQLKRFGPIVPVLSRIRTICPEIVPSISWSKHSRLLQSQANTNGCSTTALRWNTYNISYVNREFAPAS
jgi:hypothetical protein